MDVWGLASAFSDAVKKTSKDFVDTVRNTEWENEFADIKKEIREDTSEISQNAKALTEKINEETAKVVEKTGLKETVRLWGHDERLESKKTVWISENTDAKVHEIGRKIFQSTGRTYDALSKTFQKEFGLGGQETEGGDRIDNHKYTRLASAIEALEKNTDTFERDPDDLSAFESWKQEAHNFPAPKVLSAILEDSGTLQEMYDLLVPAKVTHEEFWNRYLFKLQILEKHQLLLVQAAVRSKNVESDEVDWGDTWDDEDPQTDKDIESLNADASDRGKNEDVDPELQEEKDNISSGSSIIAGPDSAQDEDCSPADTCEGVLKAEKDQKRPGDSTIADFKPSVADGNDEFKDEQLSESSFDDVTNWE